ncbi:L-type lectin-domain containing receptor kinase IV.1-like [Syzygium oleosum]|uniref:L-type lectin-domain containing receptor kinase IV.1-like n=1 Tax=Syzygium oleosum TaxID=219896 RepID=UPI0024B91B36|nr:L-type lectin-domain containing receptor kinase IV.1-like [Syzygium oleosum]
MSFKILVLVYLLAVLAYAQETNFVYNGFQTDDLSLDEVAGITPNGLLNLGYDTKQQKGPAFHSYPVQFKNSPNSSVFSFSTPVVFAIRPQFKTLSGHGIAIVVAPQRGLHGSLPSQYLGMFNQTSNSNPTNHVFGLELDTILSSEFQDINDNHVGIDLNGLTSVKSAPAGYYADGGKFKNLTLISGKAMQVWVDYDGTEKQINVTLAPINVRKPKTPLLSLTRDFASIINENMYVGFSSLTGWVVTSNYVLGWSFEVNGKTPALALSQLPKLPQIGKKQTSKVLTIGLPWVVLFVISMLILSVVYVMRRKRKFAEVLEDWERDYGQHRFNSKDLYITTKGFRSQELLGTGGFGRVYRGILRTSKIVIGVKRVSHELRQGMRELVAEIISIGWLRHCKIVSLHGYCRRKAELLLVCDYMPNGSLDKYFYNLLVVCL